MRHQPLELLALTVLLSGCLADAGGDPNRSDGPLGGKADEAGATLRFDGDWSETAEGTLRAGATARFIYDLERLTDCRGERAGIPQWGITAVYWGADGEEHTLGLTELAGDEVRPTDGLFTVPEGDELNVYFYASNRWGCIAYDSDFGANYRFEVEPRPDAATILFGEDRAEPRVEGALRRGSTVTVDYDVARLTECRATRNGRPAWGITALYRFDADMRGREIPLPVSTPSGEGPSSVTLDIPADAEWLDLSFRNSDAYGCAVWDPPAGESYQLSLGG